MRSATSCITARSAFDKTSSPALRASNMAPFTSERARAGTMQSETGPKASNSETTDASSRSSSWLQLPGEASTATPESMTVPTKPSRPDGRDPPIVLANRALVSGCSSAQAAMANSPESFMSHRTAEPLSDRATMRVRDTAKAATDVLGVSSSSISLAARATESRTPARTSSST